VAPNEPAEKLASLAVGDEREAAIWREASGEVRVTTGGSVSGSQYPDPFIAWAPDGTIVHGLLPPGATQVRLRARVEPREVAVAGGAYVALVPAKLDSRDVVAFYLDDAGNIVPVPLRASDKVLVRERVTDADTPCRACESSDWELVEVRAGPHSHLTRERLLLCRTCGRQEGGRRGAGRRRPGKHPPAVPDLAAIRGPDQSPAEIVAAAPFAVFGLAETIAGRRDISAEYRDQQITNVKIRHTIATSGEEAEITIESMPLTVEQPWDARRACASRLELDLFVEAVTLDAESGLTGEAVSLRANAHHREIPLRVQEVPEKSTDVSLDGAVLAFTVLELDGIWAAATDADGVEILMYGHGLRPEDVQLTHVVNADAYITSAGSTRHD
jgi:hypothetical protein